MPAPTTRKPRAIEAGERYSRGVDEVLREFQKSKGHSRAEHFAHGWLERDAEIFTMLHKRCSAIGVEAKKSHGLGFSAEDYIDALFAALAGARDEIATLEKAARLVCDACTDDPSPHCAGGDVYTHLDEGMEFACFAYQIHAEIARLKGRIGEGAGG